MPGRKVIALAALVLYVGLVAVAVLSPLNPFGGGKWFAPGCDYSLRMSEIKCVRSGVNPFDVWHGDVVLKPYVPTYGAPRETVEGKEGFTEEINAYPPWEYMVMMPLSFLPKTVSWLTYFALMVVGLWVLFVVGRAACRRSGAGRSAVVVSVAAILLAALPIYQNFHAGNLAIPVVVAVALMSVCLNKGHDVLAGVCWAFAMLKPQLGLVFAVPLLIRRKFLVCFVAAGLCLVLSLPPAVMCGTSPITMIKQAPAASTFAYMGCGTMPYAIASHLPDQFAIFVGLAVGAIVCALMTRRLVLAGIDDWLVLLMPAAVVGASWTYAQCYSFTMNWLFFLVLVLAIAKFPRSTALWMIAVAAFVSMTRLYNIAHTLPKILPEVVPEFLPSEEWHWHIDTLVSLIGVVLTAVLCICISRNYDGQRRGAV